MSKVLVESSLCLQELQNKSSFLQCKKQKNGNKIPSEEREKERERRDILSISVLHTNISSGPPLFRFFPPSYFGH